MIIVGVDEVGRGPLIGDVVAAAVVLRELHGIPNLKDSKKLSERAREKLYDIIRDQAHDWYIASASHLEVDKYNILQASMLAMQRAVAGLTIKPDLVLVDGDKCPDLPYRTEAIIKGDSKIAAISAASIIAKVYRDRQMIELDKQYPQYGFAQHKGYPTKQHLEALEKYGVLAQHRRSYAPVARLLNLEPSALD